MALPMTSRLMPVQGGVERGLTLIELMIALLITSIILILLTQLFITTRTTYQTDEGLARLQENARFAVQFLSRDLRMAGGTGCMGEPNPQAKKVHSYLNPTALDPVNGTFNFDRPIFGFDANGALPAVPYAVVGLYPPAPVSNTTPALNANFAPFGAIDGSDVMVLHFQSGDAAPVVKALTDGASIAVQRPHNINNGQVVMVSDCRQAFTFQVTGVVNAGAVDMLSHTAGGAGPGNVCADWSSCPTTSLKPKEWGEGAEVGQFRSVTYFIGSGGPGGQVPSLYRAVFDETGVVGVEELVEGIENMQIAYGVDTDQDGFVDSYMTAASVDGGALWPRVKTVRVGLLVSTSYSSGTSEMGVDTTPFYDIGGMAQIVVPQDQRRRRVVVETIKIRNRTIGKSL